MNDRIIEKIGVYLPNIFIEFILDKKTNNLSLYILYSKIIKMCKKIIKLVKNNFKKEIMRNKACFVNF